MLNIIEKECEWIFSSLKTMLNFWFKKPSQTEKNEYLKVLQDKENLLKSDIEEWKTMTVETLEMKIEQLKKQKLNKIKNIFFKIFTLGFYNREKQIDKKIEKLEEKVINTIKEIKEKVNLINWLSDFLQEKITKFTAEVNGLESYKEHLIKQSKELLESYKEHLQKQSEEQNKTLKGQNEQLRKEIINFIAKINEFESKSEYLEEQNEILKKQNDQLREQNIEANNEIISLKQEIQEYQRVQEIHNKNKVKGYVDLKKQWERHIEVEISPCSEAINTELNSFDKKLVNASKPPTTSTNEETTTSTNEQPKSPKTSESQKNYLIM